jgi:uncharacterized protein
MPFPLFDAGVPPQVWPVIHLAGRELALKNAAIAARCGAAGVFVISMDGRDDDIDPVAAEIKAEFPDLKVGVNYLTLPASVALIRSMVLGMDATWSDKPGVRSDRITDGAFETAGLLAARPQHLFFGSVAFKYQPVDTDPGAAATSALQLGMIPTTSGEATGQAPAVAKLRGMRNALGAGPLALASGVTPERLSAAMHAVADLGSKAVPDSALARACIQCSDPEATAWAWAAGVHLGLDPKEIVQDDEYGNGGSDIRLMLSMNKYMGINGLAFAGFCVTRPGPLEQMSGLPAYPKLAMWLQKDFEL